MIKLKKIVYTIRRVRHGLLEGAIDSELYNALLVEQSRLAGSIFGNKHLSDYIDNNLFPWLNSYISDPSNVTIMDAASIGLYETTDVIEAE